MSYTKDAKDLAEKLGTFLAETKSRYRVVKREGHWHVVTPEDHSVASWAGTPSDNHWRQNTVAVLRRREIVPRDWRP